MHNIRGRVILAVLLVLGWLGASESAYAVKSVRVSWNANSDTSVVGYKIYYGTAPRQYSSVTNVGNVTYIGLGGFTEGVTYYFNVTAYNGSGVEGSLSSSEQSLTILPIPAATPAPAISGLTNFFLSANITNSQVDFQLTQGTNVYGNNWILSAQSSNPQLIPNGNIWFSGSSNSRSIFFVPVSTEVGTSTLRVSVTDGTRTNSTNFVVTVGPPNQVPFVDAGTNVVVQTNVSVLLRGRITDDSLPANPGRISALWTKISGPGTVTFGTPGAMFTSARFSVPGFYRLRLSAYDGELTGAADVYIYVRVKTDNTPPVVSALEIAEVSDKSVTLSWNTDELANVQVEYTAQDGVPINTLMSITPKTNHLVTLSNLLPGTRYSIKAKCRDSSGNRAVTSALVVTTLQRSESYLPVSATQANLTPPMTLVTGTDGEPRVESPTANSGIAGFPFYAPVAGDYYVWARVRSPSNGSDSFVVAADSSATDIFDASAGTWSTDFQWLPVTGRALSVGSPAPIARTFHLGPGSHSLNFIGREPGCGVNRIIVTTDPNFIPEDTQPVAGFSNALNLTNPVVSRYLPTGYALISEGLLPDDTTLPAVLPGAIGGSVFFKFDPAASGYITNSLPDSTWDLPNMTLSPGEGGVLYNPADPILWIVSGALNPTPPAFNFTTGLNLLNPGVPFGGLLSQLIPSFAFAAGDRVYRVNTLDGSLRSHTFNGSSWDELPTMDLGESVWLDLVTR